MDPVKYGLSAAKVASNAMAANVAKMAAANYHDISAKSLSQYSTEMQLRPVIAIEKEIQNDEKMGTLVHTAISNFAGYYVVALSIDNTINGVSVGKILSKYSPTRDAAAEIAKFGFDTMVQVANISNNSYTPKATNAIEGISLSHEKAAYQLPVSFPKLGEVYQSGVTGLYTLSTEGIGEWLGKVVEDISGRTKEALERGGASIEDNIQREDTLRTEYSKDDQGNISVNRRDVVTASSDDVRRDVNALQNLAVGKLLNVSISRDKAIATVSLMLKPTLVGLKSVSLVAIASVSKQPKTFSERWNAFWNRETINTFWDYLFCRDLVEARARNLVEDTTGYYEEVLKRNKSNKTAALLTGEFSVGTVANTWIISNLTATRIETAIGARLDKNKRARDKFMEESGCMTLIVYNPDYQRVFIYNHGLEEVSEISMNYLEKKVNDKNFDMDVFKLLSQGSAPIL
jgi:hypothetical protein|nr:MAG TPA: hypothetical protein [Caudoviricetes sp.]